MDPPDSRWPEQRCIATPCPPQHIVAAVRVARDPRISREGRKGGEMGVKKKSKPAGPRKKDIYKKTWVTRYEHYLSNLPRTEITNKLY